MWNLTPHYIAVARISDQHKLSLRVCPEDLLEQIFTDTERLIDVTEVERTCVKRTTRVRLVNKVHVIPRDLLGGRRQVVEMKVGDAARPIGIDVGHVHPRSEWTREGIEETFFWLVDLGDPKNVVNVGDDREAGRRDQVGCCVARVCTIGVDIEALDLGCAVAGLKALAVDGDESVKVSFVGGRNWELDHLVATLWSCSTSSALFTRGSRRRRRTQAECNVVVLLLEHIDLRC